MKALYEAENVEDAIRLLQEHPEAQIIAGGSDVLVQAFHILQKIRLFRNISMYLGKQLIW